MISEKNALDAILDLLKVRNFVSEILKFSTIHTPIGPMIAIGDNENLHLLEFVGRKNLHKEIDRLRIKQTSSIVYGQTNVLNSIKRELDLYFSKELKTFTTPLITDGTAFQKATWEGLMNIPYGNTLSYAEFAESLGRPTAFRAAANANGRNQLAIIIPCHRVINSNGALGGYGGGLDKKAWLLNHEKNA